jgi:MinD-like ATPase involved in chromosome partitioning or flagellar assembly
LADNEPDWPAEPGTGAAPPAGEGSYADPERPAPAGARSVWADMLIAGRPGDDGEPEPDSAAGTGPPRQGSPYGGYGPLGSPYVGYRPLDQQHAGTHQAGVTEPGPQAPPAPDAPQPGSWAAPDATFGPYETCEAEARQGWTEGYGVIGAEDTQAEAPPRYTEPPGWQGESAGSPTADVLLPGRHAAPASGWRRALFHVTGGLLRAPESAADRRRMDLAMRARTPVAAGHHRVAVLSLKGGVGKTTTTVGLGATLASLRGDRVIAIDANPDRGTLCDKLRLETAATVRDLLNEEDQIRRYTDVRAYTTQAPSGLEVLASDRDPTVSVAFGAEDYEDVAQVLEHYYSVCVTDCGTGLLHSAIAGVLRLADQIVLVSSPSVDGARSASATLDWLAAHRYGNLVRGAVMVLSAIRPRSKSTVDLARLEQHFAARCRAVVRVPYDAYLEEGAEMDLGQLSRATADAYLVLAAEVGDGFAWPRR